MESIAIGCSVMPFSSSGYSVIRDGAGQCDLVIRRVDTSFSGNYTCFDIGIDGQHASAYLTVIG